jgi:hypothetical protein
VLSSFQNQFRHPRVHAVFTLAWSPPSIAADTALVGSCLLQKCQVQLAQCLADANCLKDIICLNQCNGNPDEQACQIRCDPLSFVGFQVFCIPSISFIRS